MTITLEPAAPAATGGGAHEPLVAPRRSQSWRPLARLAWRDVRRRPARTVLLMLIVAAPVAAITTVNIAMHTGQQIDSQNSDLELGQADVFRQYYLGEGVADAPVVDGEDGTVSLVQRLTLWRTDPTTPLDDAAVATTLIGQIGDRLLVGKFDTVEGRMAVAGAATTSVAGEATVSEEFARSHGIGPGDRLWLGDLSKPVRVVGVFRDRDDLGAERIAVPEGTGLRGAIESLNVYFPTVAAAAQAVVPAGVGGYYEATRGVSTVSNITPAMRFAVQMGTAVLLMALAMLMTAGFAAGARRQLREVGLVGANGADPRHVRSAFALQGTITSGLGVVVGLVGVAIGVAVAGDWFRRLVGSDVPLGLLPVDLVVSVVLVLAAGTLAAWWPARSVSRTPLLAALGGRRPSTPPHGGLPMAAVALGIVGMVAFAGGVAAQGPWTVLMACALLMISIAMGSTWLVAVVGGALGRAGGAARIVGRGIARQRTRTGPLVAAIAVTATMAITGIIAQATELSNHTDGVDDASDPSVSVEFAVGSSDGNLLVDQVQRLVGISPVTSMWLREGSLSSADGRWIQLIDESAAAAWSSEARSAIERGDLVSAIPVPSPVEVMFLPYSADYTPAADDIRRSVAVVADPAVADTYPLDSGALFAGLELVNRLGVADITFTASARFDLVETVLSPDADATLQALQRATQRSAEVQRALDGSVQQPPTVGYFDGEWANSEIALYRWGMRGMMAVLALFVLTALGIGLGLGRIDQREDDRLLQALGAAPGLRRRTGALEAAVLCGLAMLVALPIGYAVARVIREEISTEPFDAPWLWLIALTLGLPTIAAVMFGAFRHTPRRLPPSP